MDQNQRRATTWRAEFEFSEPDFPDLESEKLSNFSHRSSEIKFRSKVIDTTIASVKLLTHAMERRVGHL